MVIERYERSLRDHTERFVARITEMPAPEAGEPTLAAGYQYWNCLTAGPYQLFKDPPCRPAKIIAAGEWALMLGVVWINPVNGSGGNLRRTVVSGARQYHIGFETINLTNVTNGPGGLFVGAFASPAPVISVFPWWFMAADAGPNPALFETTLTADVVQSGQPFAAFSTWHFDPDREPSFMGLSAQGPELQYDQLARYLVYRK